MDLKSNLKEPLLQPQNNVNITHEQQKKTQMLQPQKTILVKLTLITVFLSGIQNFIYALIENQDVAVACLSFTGFLFVVLVIRIYELILKPEVNVRVIANQFFGRMSSSALLLHNLFRSATFFLLIWLLLIVADYCIKSGLNIGVTLAILSLATIFSTIHGRIFYNEKLTLRKLIGIIMIILGICGISLYKENLQQQQGASSLQLISDEDQLYYKIMAIIYTVVCALLYYIRGVQAKNLGIKGYSAFDFSLDSGLISGIVCMFFSLYYFAIDHPFYTLKNILLSFALSVLIMVNSLTGLTAMVKGPMGLTQGIIQSNVAFTTVLGALFLGQIPSYIQIAALALIISGVITTLKN
ncbi:UNKNOWN [Stylonychia lemnae]|uniref:Uncharacterized protein n=1 Tax=Stylonychia lemnae TaxID=5949 RepID=A0A078A2C7_STYLE|nr:UNKNOWN [Stylonychia lemnae]|eukprot:CDW75668.1 UNKNOWN [Stylonychia lemnae]